MELQLTSGEIRNKQDLLDQWIQHECPEMTDKKRTTLLCHAMRIMWGLEDEHKEPPNAMR